MNNNNIIIIIILFYFYFFTTSQQDCDKILAPISTFPHLRQSPRICTHGPRNEPEMIRLSPDWLLAVSHPNQKGRVTGGHVWPPLRRITGSLSGPQNHQRFSAVPMATAGDPGKPPDRSVGADAHN